MILIIGSEEEEHSKYMYDVLCSKGIDTAYFDSRKYPVDLFINYSPNSNSGYFIIDNKKIDFNDIQGVYWRWYYGITYGSTGNEFANRMIFRERTSALDSIFKCIKNCNWVNSIEAINMHKVKTYQLNLLASNQIRIAKTIITNDPDAMIDFYEKNNKKVIYKPVLGGAMTERLKDEDLTKEKLSTLKTSPVTLQEFIDGVDIRVYAMGEKIFPAEIKASTIDFRADNKAVITPLELPSSVVNDCKKTLKLLNLAYSGIDIRKSTDGEYVFIEANPAPMFMHFERMTKYPITESLIELLTK